MAALRMFADNTGKHRRKLLITLCLLVIFTGFTYFPAAGICYAEAPALPPAQIGENLHWSFDESSKTLVVSGRGAMPDWSRNEDVPWYKLSREADVVIVQDGITKIGSYAFWGAGECSECGASIYIPASVTEISLHALTSSCVNAFYVDSNNPAFRSIQGALFDRDGTTLLQVPGNSRGRYIIPDGTSVIGDWAFQWCCYIREIEFPAGVTRIGDYAFSSCHALTSVVFPDGLQSIGSHIFNSSSMYIYRPVLRIPGSVKSIGEDLFSRNPRPGSMEEIEVYYAGTEEEWHRIDFATPEDASGFYIIHFLRDDSKEPVSNNPYLAYGGLWVSGQRSDQTNYYDEELRIRYTGNNTFLFTWLKSGAAKATDLRATIDLDSGIAEFDDELYFMVNEGSGTITFGADTVTLHISLPLQDDIPDGYEVTFSTRESDPLQSAVWFE